MESQTKLPTKSNYKTTKPYNRKEVVSMKNVKMTKEQMVNELKKAGLNPKLNKDGKISIKK